MEKRTRAASNNLLFSRFQTASLLPIPVIPSCIEFVLYHYFNKCCSPWRRTNDGPKCGVGAAKKGAGQTRSGDRGAEPRFNERPRCRKTQTLSRSAPADRQCAAGTLGKIQGKEESFVAADTENGRLGFPVFFPTQLSGSASPCHGDARETAKRIGERFEGTQGLAADRRVSGAPRGGGAAMGIGRNAGSSRGPICRYE